MLAHRTLFGSGSSLSISCPSPGSELIAVAWPISGALLGSALPSVGRQGRNPLSSCTLKQWSLASPAGPDIFPDALPASCGALAPFRLCSRSQPQFSPWGLASKARASAPCPHPPQRVSRQASRAGKCWSAPILCARISQLCPLHHPCLRRFPHHHPCLCQ